MPKDQQQRLEEGAINYDMSRFSSVESLQKYDCPICGEKSLLVSGHISCLRESSKIYEVVADTKELDYDDCDEISLSTKFQDHIEEE